MNGITSTSIVAAVNVDIIFFDQSTDTCTVAVGPTGLGGKVFGHVSQSTVLSQDVSLVHLHPVQLSPSNG